MLGPWFTPENTKSGRSGMSAWMASITQSVGVPSICQAPSGRRAGRSGRCSVSECDVPLCSRSCATTVTVPTSRQTSASSARPGARTPSSFVTRMFMGAKGARARRKSEPRSPLGGRPALEQRQHRLDAGPQLRGKLGLEGPSGGGAELARPAILIDPLPRAVDGELLGVQEMLHQHDELDLAALVHAIARAVLRGVEEAE